MRYEAKFKSHEAFFKIRTTTPCQIPQGVVPVIFLPEHRYSESINHIVQTAEPFFSPLKKPCAMEKHIVKS
jgi:hypothetical protein